MIQSNKIVVLASAVLVIAVTQGCTPSSNDKTDKPAVAEKPAAPTGPVAKVNGKDITRDAFIKEFAPAKKRFESGGRPIQPAMEQRLKENIVRKLVEEELVGQRAQKEGIVVETTELETKITEFKGRFKDEAAMTDYMTKSGQTVDDLKRNYSAQILREKLMNKVVIVADPTQEEVKKFYDDNKNMFLEREQVKAQHILLKTEPNATPEAKKTILAEAKKVLTEVKAGKTSFEDLAKKYSQDPGSAQRGGDLGMVPRGRMVKPFEDAAFGAKLKAIVGPVETQFGYHILRVLEKKAEKQRTFAEVTEQIQNNLKVRARSTAVKSFMDGVKKEAKIEILEPGVSLDPKPINPTEAIQQMNAQGGNALKPGLMPPPGVQTLQAKPVAPITATPTQAIPTTKQAPAADNHAGHGH